MIILYDISSVNKNCKSINIFIRFLWYITLYNKNIQKIKYKFI